MSVAVPGGEEQGSIPARPALDGALSMGALSHLRALTQQSSSLLGLQETRLENTSQLESARKELAAAAREEAELRAELARREASQSTVAGILLSADPSALKDTDCTTADGFSAFGGRARGHGVGARHGSFFGADDGLGRFGDRGAGADAASAADAVRLGAARAGVPAYSAKAGEESKGEEVALSFRLAGRTMYRTADGLVVLRLETSHRGRFHECYYVVLDWDPAAAGGGGAMFVSKHTAPPFVPVRRIASQLLESDVQAFAEHVSEHLNAFVSRREQARELAAETAAAASSPAFDVVELAVPLQLHGGSDSAVPVRLEYGPLDVIPAAIMCEDEGVGQAFSGKVIADGYVRAKEILARRK